MQIVKAKELRANVPEGAPVSVTISDHSKVLPEFRNAQIFGWWIGVKANPSVNPIVLDELNGWHWLAEFADANADDVIHQVHLEVIERVDIMRVQEVRP